jgi:hypothetical protein
MPLIVVPLARQGDWNSAATRESVYTAIVGDAFVILWEGVIQYVDFLEILFDFQMALYVNGENELRWGESGSGRFPATSSKHCCRRSLR